MHNLKTMAFKRSAVRFDSHDLRCVGVEKRSAYGGMKKEQGERKLFGQNRRANGKKDCLQLRDRLPKDDVLAQMAQRVGTGTY